MTYEKQITSEQTDNNKYVYIPEPEYTKGQPAPIAANNGLSYMSFDSNGDGGSTAATLAALNQIRETKNICQYLWQYGTRHILLFPQIRCGETLLEHWMRKLCGKKKRKINL